MSTTNVKLKVDTHPIIEYNETGSLRTEMGYNLTNNRFQIGNKKIASALDNPKFMIEDSTNNINIGGFTPLTATGVLSDGVVAAGTKTNVTVKTVDALGKFIIGDIGDGSGKWKWEMEMGSGKMEMNL